MSSAAPGEGDVVKVAHDLLLRINAGPCGTIADLRIYRRDLDAVAIAGEAGLA